MSSRSLRAAVAVATVALGLALAFAGALLTGVAPASAHNQVTATVPEADSTISELPAAFSITTNEPLLDLDGGGRGFAMDIVGPDGEHYGTGCVSIVDATMSEAVSTLGPAGEYTVTWQIVSADSHTVSGDFTFEWAPTGAGSASATSAPTGAVCDAVATSTAAPVSPGPDGGGQVDLTDLAWIAGAVVAVGIAAVVTIVVLSRKGRQR